MDDERTIHVSAKTGVNLDRLLEAIDRHLQDDPVRRVHIRVPQSEGKVLAMLEGKPAYSPGSTWTELLNSRLTHRSRWHDG